VDSHQVRARRSTSAAPIARDGPLGASLEVSFLGGRQHLPIVSLRHAA
jgi:hypothetical protein